MSNNKYNGQDPFSDGNNLIDLDHGRSSSDVFQYTPYESGIPQSQQQYTTRDSFSFGEGPSGGRQMNNSNPFSDPFEDDHNNSFYDYDNSGSFRKAPLLNTQNRPPYEDATGGGGAGGFFNGIAGKINNTNDYIGMRDFDDKSGGQSDFDIRKIWGNIKAKVSGKKLTSDSGKKEPRQIYIMNHSANASFGYYDNHISTTKYNFATFLPKFLFEQFSKYANLFFLFTSIIQQVPNVSPTNRFTTIGTLMVVLLVSAIKESMEDLKRSNADKELNTTRVQVLDPVSGDFHTRKWINVKVGDVVKVHNEEPFPADLILLSSSEPEGLCYIETANLDGETNLKIKQAKEETAHLVDPKRLVSELDHSEIVSEQPNSSLYTYEGNLKNFGNNDVLPLSPDQLLLRGATLRNTQWILGVVVFTGHETKLMRNATATPIKRTDVERIINLQIVALFCILIILALVCSFGNVIKVQVSKKQLSYLYLEGTNLVGLFFKDILTYWILFSNLVPISLFVTVELIKYYQAYMIGSDLDMYYEESDTPTGVKTSSLVEELGQIDYIFSDKTGTLTRNIMEFKTCSIGGRCYIEEIPEDGQAQIIDGIEIGYHKFTDMFNDLRDVSSSQSAIINEFMTLLSTCHTVIPEVNEENGQIKYQAASPDEGALVQGAADLGYKFTTRVPKGISIINTITDQSLDYELLNICEFNSTRKRMSAIYRCPDGVIRLFCKGADNVILERLSKDEPQPFVDATLRHLEDFAAEGLRTLCIASRIIPEEEYQEFAAKYYKASTSLEDRSGELDAVAESIEVNLFLLGATAIEDKLQDGVPETIHTLQEAGIKIWVLTGDRQETAINIGMSCKLLSEDMNLLIINEETKHDTKLNLQEKLQAIYENQPENEVALESTLALIIDGHSLGFALDPELEDMFIDLGSRCKAVVCCRVSPLQKALVVKMVKRKKKKSLLLAIGDGANDVSMIQAAHVGVGISGMEGMQAARSADVSIGQFKYLKKLLLVHGAWSYRRISIAILYSFYKNIALYMTQFWFVFTNAYSGQSIAESWTLTFYNVFFTVLPPFVLGVFDQFVSARLLDRYPQLYQLGQQRKFFNVNIFWSWIINGFYHSAVIFLTAYYIYSYGNMLPGGEIANNWAWGTMVYTTCTLTVLGKAALTVTLWTKFTFLAIPGSFLLWLGFFPAFATIAPLINVSKEYEGVLAHTYPSITFWAVVFGVSILCLLRDFGWKYLKRIYSPESYHYVQEIQKYNIQDYRPRMEQFQKAIRKVRQVQRIKKQRGFAFSQTEDQEKIVRLYDTTKKRGVFGELSEGI
ncbi:aminophospholipid translocase [Scheffersomyces spartinae]|uniref:Phospholipid-transporting ATPase n=1 Tax=Scheffersomyces spartinae TaxID=45513 RepID=A0A9P7V8F9_9ASCO|nr:aminophospholipid translocase [Scheffersomyces spartinae]KAG7193218.1 aminophospholipid translocase [Scheffersomyces spartinae]